MKTRKMAGSRGGGDGSDSFDKNDGGEKNKWR
jgi:hypothetical protein